MSLAGVQFDTKDLERKAKLMRRAPAITAKAFARAQRHAGKKARTQIVRMAAKDADMRVKDVRDKTQVFNAGPTTVQIVMRSGWMPLYKLGGATQSRRGVRVKGFGSHKGAFIARMKSGHVGVFRRTSAKRLPIKELWGPNPVSYIHRDTAKYAKLGANLMKSDLMPRFWHEFKRLID